MSGKILILSVTTISLMLFGSVRAQEVEVDYGDSIVVDMDLDGITDQGEIQIFKTDPTKPDTDGDGFADGVEVLSGTNPNDQAAYPGSLEPVIERNLETPWAWYISRAAGLLAFALLYVSIFLGLTLRIPLLRKIFAPVHSMKIHCWISFQATVLAFLHGGVLLFDKFLKLSLVDLFVPLASSYETVFLSLGIFSFYFMLILVATSYGRKHISQKLWRVTHFINIILYVIVLVHIFAMGTDLKNPIFFDIFLFTNAFLVLLMLINMQLRIAEARRRRKEASLNQTTRTGSEGDQSQSDA